MSRDVAAADELPLPIERRDDRPAGQVLAPARLGQHVGALERDAHVGEDFDHSGGEAALRNTGVLDYENLGRQLAQLEA